MAKLIRYKNKEMRFFGDGEWEQGVDLYLEEKYFFGLFKRDVHKVYVINMFQSLKTHWDYWDDLIKNQKEIKL